MQRIALKEGLMRRQGTKGSYVITDLAQWTFNDDKATQHVAEALAKAMELSYNLDILNRLEVPDEE